MMGVDLGVGCKWCVCMYAGTLIYVFMYSDITVAVRLITNILLTHILPTTHILLLLTHILPTTHIPLVLTNPLTQAYEAALIAKAEAAAAAAASTAGGSTGEGGGALPAGLRLEDPSVLVNPGQRDGEVKVVREDGAGVAYQWSASG